MTNSNPSRAAIWARVSSHDQHTENQLHTLRSFANRRDYPVVTEYVTEDSAWTGKHRAALDSALADAHRGVYRVLIVWSIDRLSRQGIEETFRVFRQFRERGVTIISHEEPWLTEASEVQDLMLAIASWLAKRQSNLRSANVKAGLERRRSQGLPLGRPAGSKDRKPRRRSGYVARWENERAQKGGAR